MLLFPSFKGWNCSGRQPGNKTIHSAFFHLLNAELLHFFSRVYFSRRKKLSILITHRTILFADGTVFF
jgi:hypothetical protein